VCTSSPALGLRCQYADLRAPHTSFASIVSDIDQPTIGRLTKSITTAKYSQPSPVATYVMSATQARLGRQPSKRRSRRLGATGKRCLESVVATHARR
jgi:hypothetical protein